MKTTVKAIFANPESFDGKEVYISGWVRNLRASNAFGFIELNDGTIVTGKTSKLMGAAAAALLNALKKLGGIDDSFLLLPAVLMEPLQKLKVENLGNNNPRLHSDEILIALAISATTNPVAAMAMEQLPKLRGCQAHVSVMLTNVDKTIYKKLGIDLTSEPLYATKKLYHKQ